MSGVLTAFLCAAGLIVALTLAALFASGGDRDDR